MAERPTAVFALYPHLIPDIFSLRLIERLRRSVDIDPTAILTSLDGPAEHALLDRADILLTGWGCPRLDASALTHASRLRAVLHAAGSVKGHTTPALFAAGILVSSAVHVNARPVAEFTLASIVLARKRAFSYAADYRAGKLPAGYEPAEDTGLAGSTIGVIGASRIGKLVLGMLAGYGVHLLVHDPYLDEPTAQELGAELVDLDELCRRSDVVTLHAPDLPETRSMIDDRRLSLMRDGAALINTARGALIDTPALTAHCANGRLDAVLDVTDPEPLPAGHDLLHMPNVLVTPHLAGARGRELHRLGEFVVSEVERLVTGRPLTGAVNAADLPRIA